MGWTGPAVDHRFDYLSMTAACNFDPLAMDARAERWAARRARERGEPAGELERAAVLAEARAWRNSHNTTGGDATDSVAWRLEQEQAAAQRGQAENWAAVYGPASGAGT